MMCQRCQFTVEDGLSFCPKCGAPVAASEESVPAAEAVAEVIPAVEMPEEAAVPTALEDAVAEDAAVEEAPVKKPKAIGWIVAAAIAVVVIAAALVLVFLMNGKTGLDGTWKATLHLDKFVELYEKEVEQTLSMAVNLGDVDLEQINVVTEGVHALFGMENELSAYLVVDKDVLSVYINPEELKAPLSELYDNTLEFIENGNFYTFMELAGYDREDVEILMAQNGYDVDTLITSLVMGKGQIMSMIPTALEQAGFTDDGRGNYKVFETSIRFEDGNLRIAPSRGAEMIESLSIPLVIEGDTLTVDTAALGVYAYAVGDYLDILSVQRSELP